MATSDCPNNGRRVQAEEDGGFVDFCVSITPNKMTRNQAASYCGSQGGFLACK